MTTYYQPYLNLPYTYGAWYAEGCLCVDMPQYDTDDADTDHEADSQDRHNIAVEKERIALFLAGWYSGEWLPYEGAVHEFPDGSSLTCLKVTDTLLIEGENTFCCENIFLYGYFIKRKPCSGFAPAIPINCESYGWRKPPDWHTERDELGFAISYLLWDRDFDSRYDDPNLCYCCGTDKDSLMLDCPNCGKPYGELPNAALPLRCGLLASKHYK